MRDYKEMLEKARVRYDEIKGTSPSEEKFLLDMFSELAESDDEIIRKDIISLLKFANHKGVYDKYISWLEKQGESTLIEEIKRRKELYSREKEKAVLNIEKLSLGGRIAMLEELLVFINEKQYGQKPFSYENVNIPQRDFEPKTAIEAIKEEKINNQNCVNPTDKVEPKFKVRDWITDGYVCGQITSIEDDYPCYKITDCMGDISTSIPFTLQDNYHIWSISDAKPGDILAECPNEVGIYSPFVAIFKERNFFNPDDFNSYCFVSYSGEFCTGENGHNSTDIHPATKKQCDLLFKKMEEEDYTWDAEKKELKELANSEQISKNSPKFQVGDWIISNINCNVYRILNIKDNKYQLDYLEGTYWYDKKYIDGICRIWDIKDAKDGDILADEYSIILFRKIGNAAFDDVIDFHVGLSLVEDKIVKRNGIRHYGYIEDTEFKPATKEQRKMFLQRIHEDGYVI